jgi:ABC-type glycerol-3-phosphate transport system permease component
MLDPNKAPASAGRPRARRPRFCLSRAAAEATLAVVSLLTLAPLAWMVLSSLKSQADIIHYSSFLPSTPRFDNYAIAWESLHIVRYFLNSIVYTALGVLGITALGAMAAFALTKYALREGKGIFALFLCGQMVPVVMMLVPLFHYLKMLGLSNTVAGMVLVYIGIGLPFAIILLEGFFRDFPDALIDAARIDGCSEPRIFFGIVLPLSGPGVSCVVIFQSVWLWNEFLMALVLLLRDAMKPLTVGLYSAVGQYSANYPVLFAGLTIASLPIIVLFGIFQKQFINGLTGSVKG